MVRVMCLQEFEGLSVWNVAGLGVEGFRVQASGFVALGGYGIGVSKN